MLRQFSYAIKNQLWDEMSPTLGISRLSLVLYSIKAPLCHKAKPGYIFIMKETLVSSDTSFTVRAVIQLYMNILLREPSKEELKFQDVLTTTR